MKRLITRMIADEDAAVTVDWVVLTAAIVGLGLAVMVVVGTAAKDGATDIATTVSALDETFSD